MIVRQSVNEKLNVGFKNAQFPAKTANEKRPLSMWCHSFRRVQACALQRAPENEKGRSYIFMRFNLWDDLDSYLCRFDERFYRVLFHIAYM